MRLGHSALDSAAAVVVSIGVVAAVALAASVITNEIFLGCRIIAHPS